MDSKNQKIKRPKRQQKVIEDYWDCSVCTFRNTAEAFKCLMCDVRKGKTIIKVNSHSCKMDH
jgi:YY1-associated factor 2